MPFFAPSPSTPATTINTIASSLVRFYEESKRDEMMNGHFMSVRTVPANDIPTITASTTAPASDTDVATKYHSLVGRAAIISGGAEITLTSEIDQLETWISGFNRGLRCRWAGDMYRLSGLASSFMPDVGNGSQDNNLSPQMKIDSIGVYMDVVLEGDVLYITGTGSSRFTIWVNDRLITTAVTAVGTGITGDASGATYTITGASRQYFKIKFPSVGSRTIRVFHYGAGGIGDLYTRITHNVFPRHTKRLNWLHVSDVMGTSTSALNNAQTAAHYLQTSFGSSINFVNASLSSTGIASNNGTTSPHWLDRWDTDLKLNKQMDVVTIFGSYLDTNKGDLSDKTTALINKIKTAWPNCEVILAYTVTTAQISGGSDLTTENVLASAASAAGATFLRAQTDPQGRWLTGTSGSVTTPAGLGNADLYVQATSAPSPAGHAYWGRRWAHAIYQAMRSKEGV